METITTPPHDVHALLRAARAAAGTPVRSEHVLIQL